MSMSHSDKFSSEVSKLKTLISQNNALKNDICEELDGVDQKLSSVEQYMTKLNADILPLKIARGNIADYMDELTKVCSHRTKITIQYYFDTVARTASALEVGSLPNHPKEYTDGMIQVKDSIIFLEPHTEWKSQPQTLSLLKDISNRAIKECSDEVAKYLSGENILIDEQHPPVAKTEGSINGITSDKLDYLRLIIDTCQKCGYSDIQSIFIKGRIEYFKNCIQYYINTPLPEKKQEIKLQCAGFTFKQLFNHLEAEWELLASLFSSSETTSLIKQLLNEPLEIICKHYNEGEAALKKVQVLTYEEINSTIINALDALNLFEQAMPLYEDFLSELLLNDLLSPLKTALLDCHDYLFGLLMKSINTLDKYVYSKSVFITNDGSVNKVTISSISLLNSMITYRSLLLSLLRPYEAQEKDINKFLVYDDVVQLYYSKYLLTLRQLLVVSTKSNPNIVLSHFYLINNFNYIIDHFKPMSIAIPEYIQDIYSTVFNEEFRRYRLLTWKKVGDILNSNPDIVFAKDDKLEEHSASSIRSIIDQLKYQIDYIIGEECVWTVVSADLKAKYIQLAMDLVPDYVSFFTKYSNTNFEGYKDKDILYTPEQFKEKIQLLFSSTK